MPARAWFPDAAACRAGVAAALARGRGRLFALRRSEEGASAVEFALVAPVLVLALLATADVGLALYERMTVDHVLRSGAQAAMNDAGETAVLEALRTVAAKNFTVVDSGVSPPAGSLAVSADRYCACPEERGVEVSCSVFCAGNAAPQIYYQLGAQGGHAGMIIPRIDFSPIIEVQVR